MEKYTFVENINGDKNDPYYRYKMPRININTEHIGPKHNKTIVTNLASVASALQRSPMHLLRYLGFELSSTVKYDKETETGIVNGGHSWDNIHKALMKFIRTFVLCSKCNNPETNVGVHKNTVKLHCNACGSDYDAPPTDKLTKFIIREAQSEEEMKRKEEKKKMKFERSRKKGKEEMIEEGDVIGSSSSTSPHSPCPSTSSSPPSSPPSASSLPQHSISSSPSSITNSKENDLERIQDHPMMDVFNQLFPTTVSIAALQKKEVVEKLMQREGEIGQISVIVALERLVAVKNRTLLSDFPQLLDVLYRAGVVEDEHVVGWHANPALSTAYGVPEAAARETRQSAGEFIEYLGW